MKIKGKSEKEINEVVGKLDEFTDEEPDSVDTVTNFTNSIPIILSKQLIKEGYSKTKVLASSSTAVSTSSGFTVLSSDIAISFVISASKE